MLRTIVALFAVASFSKLHAQSAGLDKPLNEQRLNLGRSRYLMSTDHRPVELHCFYYPSFMVKEKDDPGVKGAVWVAIAPSTDTHTPACSTSVAPGQKPLNNFGYFTGAKNNMIVLQAADGLNEGIYFEIIEWPTGKKLFHEEALSAHRTYKPDIQFGKTPEGDISLSFRRVVVTTCSIPRDGAACWQAIRDQYSIPATPIPECIGYQQPGEKEWKVGDPGVPSESRDTPSAVAYPVIVTLMPRPHLIAQGGPVRCNASE